MESFNFGAFDPTIGARLANIPQEAQKQQTANMLQAMQMQGAMREGQMSQMKIDEMLAERKEIDTFAANLKARGYTQGSKGFFTELASSRNPTRMQQGFEGLRRLEEQDKFAAIMGRTRPAAAPVAPEPGSFSADMAARREADPFASRTNMLPGAAAAPAGVNAMAGNAAEIEFKRQQRNDLIGMGTTQSIAAARAIDADIALLARKPSYQNVPGVGLVNTDDKSVVMPSVEKPAAPPSMVAEYTFAKTPDGGNFRGTFQDFVTARAAAVRPLAQPRPEQPPVAVVDPATGKQVLVSRDEAITRRMTPANAAEGLAPKEIQRREATFPKATAAVKAFEVSADSLVKDLETLAVHPGLDSITGLLAGRIIGLTSEGRAAKALYDKIVARGGFQELQNVRVASPTGGGLGNVSNQEGTQLKNAFAAVDRTQDAPDVRAALTRAAEETKASKGRVREAYELTYEYRPPLKSAGADKPTLSPADQEALAWAAANPNDPRAAQIRQKNGVK